MRQALFGTQRNNGFGLGIERYRIAILVPIADRPAQSGDAFGLRVTVCIAASDGLTQLFDNMCWCRLVWVAHTEIDNVLAPSARGLLQLSDDVEDVRGKTLDALKMGIH